VVGPRAAGLRAWIAAAVLCTVVASCSTLQVSHDYDPGADFAALSTYAWAEASDDPTRDRLMERRAIEHANRVLAEKGFVLVATGPDFLIAVHDDVRQKLRVTDLGFDGYAFGPYWSAYGSRRLDVTEYDEGLLILDVIEPGTQNLIWRGVARRPTDERATPTERDARVGEAVEALLAPFPPEVRQGD
jgi:hypothetical protein